MKKIGFITENKLLAQSLANSIGNYPDLGFETCLLTNTVQILLDAEIQKINVAVVDMTLSILAALDAVDTLCAGLRKAVPGSKILLLVPQRHRAIRTKAMSATSRKVADDYVFWDATLDYLLSKLLAL